MSHCGLVAKDTNVPEPVPEPEVGDPSVMLNNMSHYIECIISEGQTWEKLGKLSPTTFLPPHSELT